MHQKNNHVPKSLTVTVRITAEELTTMQAAAQKLWPGAPLLRSQIIKGLAMLEAQRALKK